MLPWQHFCQGALRRKFQFFVKNGPFLLQKVFISDFWLEFKISASELTPVPNFNSVLQKIKELECWPGTLPKTAWWRHTFLLVMTSANFLWLLRDFVQEYHHAKFGCNWTTNKGEPIWFQKTPAWIGLRLGISTAAQYRQICKVGTLLPHPWKTSVLSWGAFLYYNDWSTILRLLPGAVQQLKLLPTVCLLDFVRVLFQ